MITKTQGKACLAQARDMDQMGLTMIQRASAVKALKALGWCAAEGQLEEVYFDMSYDACGPLEGFRHQAVTALCFAAAVAGVKP